MIRGTTPTLIFKIKTEIDFDSISKAEIYFKTINKTLTVDLTRIIIDAENKTISIELSQEESLSLCIGKCMVQLRIMMNNGSVMATKAQPIDVDALLAEGEMN